MVGIGRWFLAALLVSVISLTGITAVNAGLSSVLDFLGWSLLFAVFAAIYIFGAALLAGFVSFLVGRFIQPPERFRSVIAVGVGGLSGLAVMALGAVGFEPDFLVIATVAGGTGGALSVADVPLFSRRGMFMLCVGLGVSAVLLTGTTLAVRGR